MARRRVQSKFASGGVQEADQGGFLQTLGNLANFLPYMQQQQEMEDIPELRGTAAEEMQEEIEFPQLPRNVPPQDQMFVDDVPGIPEGIELLGDLAQTEAKEDALDRVSDTKTPYSLPQTLSGDLQDPLETIRMRIQEEPELEQYLPKETLEMLASTAPQPEKPFVPPQEEMAMEEEERVLQPWEREVETPKRFPWEPEEEIPPEDLTEQLTEEVEEPEIPPAVQQVIEQPPKEVITEEDIPEEGLEAMAGSVEAAESDPVLQEKVKNLLNLKQGDVPPEVWEHAKMMERIYTEKEENLNDQERQLQQRLESGEMSMLDKVALGLAIALPVIIGLTYGKEAFFSTVGGTLKGFSESMMKDSQMKDKIQEKIGSVQKEKEGIAEKKANLTKELLNNIENPALRKLLKNYDVINVIEGPNGEPEIQVGKDAIVIGNDIGITAKDEDGILWYDANVLRDDEDVKNFRTAAQEGKQALAKMKDANQTIDDVMDLMSDIQEQDPSAYSALVQYIQPSENSWFSFGGAAVPKSLKALTVDIVGDDGKVRQVKALPLLKQKITALQDVYNKEYLGGNRLTSNLLTHWQDIFPDPTSIGGWLKSDFSTMVQQAQGFKNTLNQRAIENLAGLGFLREPLKQILPVRGSDILQSTSIGMKDIEENPEKYKSLIKGK